MLQQKVAILSEKIVILWDSQFYSKIFYNKVYNYATRNNHKFKPQKDEKFCFISCNFVDLMIFNKKCQMSKSCCFDYANILWQKLWVKELWLVILMKWFDFFSSFLREFKVVFKLFFSTSESVKSLMSDHRSPQHLEENKIINKIKYKISVHHF